jgi:ParB family chromosome partitioning protein
MFKASSASDHAVQEFRELALEEIVPNPSQPRRKFDETELQALARSIGKRGVLQPVLVRPGPDGKHELIAGERRWRAAALAGLQRIPALVSHHDDAAALEIALIENLAREDLNPVEEARAIARLANGFGLSYQQIADRVGRHRSVVSNVVRLLNLSEEIHELLERGELSTRHGIVLLKAKDPQARSQLARAAVEEGLTTLALERRARASNVDVLQPEGSKEQRPDLGEVQDLAALNLARAWGDLLGAEVHVRPMPRRYMRMEVVFGSAAQGIALADRLAAAITRGSKGS